MELEQGCVYSGYQNHSVQAQFCYWAPHPKSKSLGLLTAKTGLKTYGIRNCYGQEQAGNIFRFRNNFGLAHAQSLTDNPRKSGRSLTFSCSMLGRRSMT